MAARLRSAGCRIVPAVSVLTTISTITLSRSAILEIEKRHDGENKSNSCEPTVTQSNVNITQSKREALTPHCEQQRPSPHGLSGPQAPVSALQVPEVESFVVDEVVDVAEVVTVAPVPLVVDEELLLLEEVVVEVLVETSSPSHSLEICNSAQFQNCSGTPRPSSGRG